MGDTIEEMDIEKETKDNKKDFLENKIRLPDSKDIEEMNKLGLKKISSKREGDRVGIDYVIRLLIINTRKIKKQN